MNCVWKALILGMCIWCSALSAQDGPKAPVTASRTPEITQTTNDWKSLASSLEQRLARLLPCDPRIAVAIGEVSTASDARIAALTAEAEAAATESQRQVEALRKRFSDQDSAMEKWRDLSTLAERERADVQEQHEAMVKLAGRAAAFEPATQSLGTLLQSSVQGSAVSAQRYAEAAKIAGVLREWIIAGEARNNAIESRKKAITQEGDLWRAYYKARTARAKAECAVTNPGADPDRKASRARRAKRKKSAE